MKITAGTQDKKKVGILIALLVIAAVVFFINSSDASQPVGASVPAAQPTPAPTASSAPPASPQAAPARRTAGTQRTLQEFRPSLRPRRGEERPDPNEADPTLRLDLLAKLQSVDVEGARRSIFDFGQAPPPKPDPAKAGPVKPVPSPLLNGQAQGQPQPSTPPPPPPPPKVPLKFYGFISGQAQTGARRAFFLDGEEIHVVTEGEIVKRRYRIVRIGVNSVVVEDLEYKHQQTVPLEEAPNA